LPAATHPPRILIVRLSSLGDVIHAMPAVAALRARHPDAHIAWAVDPAWAPLLRAASIPRPAPFSTAQPLLNALHLVPFKRWARRPLSLTTLAEIRASRRELAAPRYDIAVDMQGSLRSAWVARWSRSPRILGEDAPREAPARFLFTQRVPTRGVHVIEQDIELADAIFGDQLPYTQPPFPIDPDAEAWADGTLAAHPAPRYAVLLPGAGWPTKRWPPERYGAVAAGLAQLGFHSFFNAGPGEESLALLAQQAAASAAFSPAFSPANSSSSVTNSDTPPAASTAAALPASLSQLIALLRRSALCIGGDTGPLHLASALGIPCIGIYGPTDPARNGPYHSPFRVLRHPDSQRDHSRRGAPEPGLLTISPDDVLSAVADLLKGLPA
jgi:heptosyltransferase-1